jgi:hypothetical protein
MIITKVGILCEEIIGIVRVGTIHMNIWSYWVGGGSGLIYKFLDDKVAPLLKLVYTQPTL